MQEGSFIMRFSPVCLTESCSFGYLFPYAQVGCQSFLRRLKLMTSQETLVPRGRLRAVQEQWVDQSQIETRVIELRSTTVHYLNYHFLQLINARL